MDFKSIEKKYRPIPFWSWNSKLERPETERQIELMDKAGMGGYFMHARGGLATEYMGEEWFENITAGIEEGNKRKMQPWAYDENGWPSGFGNGSVNGLGEEYQQKYLRWDYDVANEENTICIKDGIRFYYEINPFYVDTLDRKVADEFIKRIYQPYYDRYGDGFSGFFCDEPQISRNGIPWSLILPEAYEKEYGESLLERVDELFFPKDRFEDTRVKFWRLVTVLFSDNFMKPIYDWCIEHNLGFTGHLACEETLEQEVTCNGACMPHYEYFTMPGMDWLGRDIFDCLTPLQLTSAAHQLGKKEILSESFALCGHNVGFDELKAILQWQMLHGVTKLCQHLQGYSLAGLRKRDYPPAMYYQQPWWDEYKLFNDAMSRVGKLLAEGRVEYNTLLLHNISSAWKCFDGDKNGDIQKYNDALLEDYGKLMGKHILFHFGDELLMERHARVEGKELVIGTQRYSTVIIPKNNGFLENTQRLLAEFEANGGKITTADEAEENNICSSPYIFFTERIYDDCKIYFFINNNNEEVRADFAVGSKMIDIKSGEIFGFSGEYTFAPFDSLVLIDDGTPFEPKKAQKKCRVLNIDGEWRIDRCSENILTLDTCDVYFDGELVGIAENAADVLYMALEKRKSMKVRLEYKFCVRSVPKTAYLVCETPQKFAVGINGIEVGKEDCGYFADKSFRKIKIGGLLKKGVNTVSTEIYFAPKADIYDDLEKAFLFETEKNKLTFDTEFEAIYIIGDFSVKTDGTFTKLDRNAVRYDGGFVIDKPEKEIGLANIEQQGFPFFAGRMTVCKEFFVKDTDYILSFEKKGINCIHIKVNGIDMGSIMWGRAECDISEVLKSGKNVIELTLVNNLRNMLGPYHLTEGESYWVCPSQFYRRKNVWNHTDCRAGERDWDSRYCFAEFSLENKK